VLLPINIDFILVFKGARFKVKKQKNLVRASGTLFGNTVRIKEVIPVSIRKAQAAVSCLPHTPAGEKPTSIEEEAEWAPEPISRVKGKEEYLDPAKSQIRISRSANLCPVTFTTELRPTSRIRSTCPDNLARLHVNSGRMSMPF
jgi:hypothetical protein